MMSLEWSLATMMYHTTLCNSAIYFHLKFCKSKSYLTNSDGLINADWFFFDKCITIQTRRQLVYTNVTNSVTISSAFSLLSLCGCWVFQYYITVSSFDCPNSINMETLWLEDICTSVLYILQTITNMYKDSYRDH